MEECIQKQDFRLCQYMLQKSNHLLPLFFQSLAVKKKLDFITIQRDEGKVTFPLYNSSRLKVLYIILMVLKKALQKVFFKNIFNFIFFSC